MNLRRLLARLLGRGGRRQRLDEYLPERLWNAIVTVAAHLNKHGVAHALIGGVAVSAHGAERFTKDVDFLVDEQGLGHVDDLMHRLRFEVIQRGENVVSYLLDRLRLDFMAASGPYRRAMLTRALPIQVRGLPTRVVRIEDVVGLKLQALAHNPSRGQDRIDIDRLDCLSGRRTSRPYSMISEEEAAAMLEDAKNAAMRDEFRRAARPQRPDTLEKNLESLWALLAFFDRIAPPDALKPSRELMTGDDWRI